MINYYLLMKPGIVLGNLVTVVAGFLLASKGAFHLGLFIAVIIGLGLIMASGCVFNNYIDRELDRKMTRTQNRPLVTGKIPLASALFFGLLLGIAGNGVLFFYTNLLTLIVADIGFIIYVLIYSLWKGKTVYGTAIGSLAGAVPPVVGYCAVSNSFDLGAVLLFVIMVLWQMPHFFAIALFHLEDYKAAKIPVLPLEKGIFRTKVHMLLYVIAFTVSAAALTFFGFTGYVYLSLILAMSLLWFMLCLRGFVECNDILWGRQMFQASLVMIGVLSFMIPIDLIST